MTNSVPPVIALCALFIVSHAASDIELLVDSTVDPCVDFYRFSCGNYEKRTQLADDKGMTGPLIEMDDKLNEQLRTLLEATDQPNDPKSALLARQYYRSCIDVNSTEKLHAEPLLETLKQFGGWPVLGGQQWAEAAYDWATNNARIFREIGETPIISFSVYADYKNSSSKMLTIDQLSPVLGHRDYYLDPSNSKIMDAYRKFMLATVAQLGTNETAAKTEVDDMIKFETALANISVNDAERRDYFQLYNPMTIAELKAAYPKLKFDKWLKYMAENGYEMKDNETVNVDGAPYLKQLNEIIRNFSVRTIANYQLWVVASALVSYLAPSLREPYREYQQALNGVAKFKTRWEECVQEVNDMMDLLVGAIYVKDNFPPSNKEDVDKMVTNIRTVMMTTIENADWMDEETKAKAKEKLTEMVQQIGYPNYIHNETKLLRDLEALELHEDRYLENAVRISKSTTTRLLRGMHERVDRDEWEMGAAVVNAMYSPNKNAISFPAAILQSPVFVISAPSYANYGGIGQVIGHEITHGYDDQGRQFDAKGNLVSWWSNETLSKFQNRTQCFIDQYSNVKSAVIDQYINGENTVGENIADNGGLKLAYKAYQLWKSSAGAKNGRHTASQDAEEPALPSGLSNYTMDQLFFLAYGQSWCLVARPEYIRRQILTDVHSPFDVRVNVPLQNSEAFAETYKCPIGSPMNPKEKCDLW